MKKKKKEWRTRQQRWAKRSAASVDWEFASGLDKEFRRRKVRCFSPHEVVVVLNSYVFVPHLMYDDDHLMDKNIVAALWA